MTEKLLDKKLCTEIKRMKGLPLKFHSATYTGMPDRIILMPGGRVYFAEIKTTGKRPPALQSLRVEMLKGMGFKAFVIDDEPALNEFIRVIKDDIPAA